MSDVFISYSRKDKEFVKKLHEALKKQNRDTWVDWQNIPLTGQWWKEIEAGIEAANTFAFVISPDSISSKVCTQEIDHAVKCNKRLVPIVRRDDDVKGVHPDLAKHNWIFFRDSDDFDSAFDSLLKALDTDLNHVKEHTRLLVRALEWDRKGRQADLLLRGSELAEAQAWLMASTLKKPEPLDLHQEYITASQEAIQQEAQRWKELYEKAKQERKRAEIAEIEALNAASHALWLAHDQLGSLVTCVKAGRKLLQTEAPSEIKRRTVDRLRQTLHRIQERNRLEGHNELIWSVNFSPDGQTIATASEDKTVKLWSKDGEELKTLTGHDASILSASFSPDSQTIATASADKTIKLWSKDGEELKTLTGHKAALWSVVFSPDGKTIATASEDNSVKFWSRDGQELQTLTGHHERVNSVSFSPDGQTIATASFDNTVKLWSIDGQELQTLTGHHDRVYSVSFSPDSQTIATASYDKTVKLWSHDGKQLQTLSGHHSRVVSVNFSPDGQTIATASFDNTVKLWSIDGQELQTLTGHKASVWSVVFSPDSQTIATASFDKTVKLWSHDRLVQRGRNP